MNLSILSKMTYENFIPLAEQKNKPNQTQFKANSNPISEMPKMNVSIYYTKVYNNKTAFRRIRNKPKTNPIQTQFPIILVFLNCLCIISFSVMVMPDSRIFMENI